MYQNTPVSFRLTAIVVLVAISFVACKKDDPDPVPPPVVENNPSENMPTPCLSPDQQPGSEGPGLVFKFRFNDQQVRLNNIGQPEGMPAGNAGQSPDFNVMSAHYIELAPTAWTGLGEGQVLYVGPETDAGDSTALDFDQAILRSECEDIIRIPFSTFEPGTYEWIRVSLAYQNYDIQYRFNGQNYNGTIASFIGFNTYISTYNINTESIELNDDKAQGYWGFETTIPFWGTEVVQGQAPAGATTVPNPLFQSSPIEPGSCVVTGDFNEPLVISGNETEDIVIVLSLSTNNSFEWIDGNGDGLYEPLTPSFQPSGEIPVDMGVRGLEPIIIE